MSLFSQDDSIDFKDWVLYDGDELSPLTHSTSTSPSSSPDNNILPLATWDVKPQSYLFGTPKQLDYPGCVAYFLTRLSIRITRLHHSVSIITTPIRSIPCSTRPTASP
jgi:hypothetical protein